MKIDDKIRHYIRNRMTQEDRLEFEVKLKNNPELAKEVEIQRFAIKIADKIQNDSLLEQMRSYSKKEIESRKPKKNRYLFAWGIAASIVLILGTFTFYTLNQFSTKRLYSEAKDKYPPFEDKVRSNEKDIREFESYKILILQNEIKERAPEAIDYFSSFDSSNVLFPRAQFNLAYSFFLNENNSQAINTFQKIINSDYADKELKHQSQFYLALVYLVDNQYEQAVEQLDSIVKNNEHQYRTRAQKLIEKLSSPWRKLVD